MTNFDSDKIEKIITNILSNAIKHTENHGAIEMDVLVDESGNDIEIIISDTGSGINPKDMEKVFNRFYKISEQEGTGLGLALVKGLVNFLGGSISVKSNLQRGTYVAIHLPLSTEKPFENYPKVVGNKKMTLDADLVFGMGDEEEKGALSQNLDKDVQEVLLVEDNEEMRSLLKSFFGSRYRVRVAENGKKALSFLKKNKPDLVISDIMMPYMDGMELCKAIKQDLDTSHIPVILLTAKSEFETKLESLNLGADAFISKPFDIREIDLVVNNILDTRRNLKQHFLKFGNLNDVKIPINNRDQDFLEKLRKIVENHMEDSDFNISTFTKEAGVSRTLLHTKIKKLVGMSATEFVKTIRLNHAAKLLVEQELTVSEVAYKVGYADSNYFSRSFKGHFNVSPTEYKEQPLE